MKKHIITSLTILAASTAFAQSPVQIKGTFDKEFIKPVKLFKVVEGDMEEIASAQPQLNKKFGFTFYPEYEGFYAIGSGTTGSQTENNIFYFKPGDQLEFIISENSYQLTGTNNSKENQILNRWHNEVTPIEQKAFNWMKVQSTFVDFFPDLETVVAKANTFTKNNKSGNFKFDSRLQDYIQWDLAANATNFLNTPRSAHPAVEEYADYYKNLTLAKFAKNASLVYQTPWANRTLNAISFVSRRAANIPPGKGITGLQQDMDFLPNDTLKGDAILSYLAKQKDYASYKEAADKYQSYFLTASQKKRATVIMNNMAQLKSGDQGLNFSFPDNNGKTIKFADLKGKVVLIDVWATWCGPCKAEIPHLKKLEQELHGTDVQVVSISVDEEKDKAKWLKMIKDEQLGGLQLFASGWGDFAKYYKITGIPRFMVFDKQGKVVTIDSPRPSSPELKQLLEKVLATK
ncbi:TlpA disulfide reductase family protein [Sphingobacterium sp. BIGb0165]|uniref:TlpA family protein disulfide reductase n=1 Tax=Sphingobacterium sp. BIGb0165 TaxID=2940615 RepID=UPI002166EE62|nr:TlpA disulfide reductase family protein [Sphingobacterium sp. BIGb0165]MCS4228369.1 thiol-disulfide isomerase/thioredoxin [Sphingobacterium sp. BIGb0165]